MISRRRQFFLFASAAAILGLSGFAVRAQAPLPLIGFLSSRSASDSASVEAAFRRGLREAGYEEGRNFRITHRWAEGRFDRLPGLARELVEQGVSVIAAVGGDIAVLAAKAATTTIPIVMVVGSDPAETGLVTSLARPGGNITGVTLYSEIVEPKRFELLRELVPTAKAYGVLLHVKDPLYARKRRNAEAAAQVLGQRIHFLEVNTERDIETSFATLSQMQAGGLLVGTAPFFSTHRKLILALAARNKVPTIFDSREQVVSGGLLSYGSSYEDTYRQAGIYVGRVLKGARPAELPVLLPTRFELVINLTTAKALNLSISHALQLRADEVIE